MRLLDFHRRVMDRVAARIEGLGEAELAAPTGLGWSVAELVGHLVAINTLCCNSAHGIGPDHLASPAELIGDDVLAAYRTTSAGFSDAFRDEDVYERLLPTPVGPHPGATVLTVGTVENLVHGWDLTQALQTDERWPDELTTEALGRVLTLEALFDYFRTLGWYAAALPPDPNAPAQQRLLAFLGRAA